VDKDKALRMALEALAQEQDNAYIYASNLAKTIWQKHWMKESPKFELLDTTEGVLTQIDNMICRLVREKPAQPEQEPVQVSPLDFVTMTLEKEHLVGRPIIWAQWPNEEKNTC
jgi:hypothetical protein